jgi:hypothetical protein
MIRLLATAALIAIALPLSAAGAGTIDPFADQQTIANHEAELLPMAVAPEPPQIKSVTTCEKAVPPPPKKRGRRAHSEPRCSP